VLFIFFCLLSEVVIANDASIYQTNLNLVERIARLEEGQKAIIIEMRTRFKAVDERFVMLEKSIDKRFESIDKRFEYIDKRFESIDKRFESIENQVSSLAFFVFTMLSAILASIIGLIAYIIWDRKTVFEKIEHLFQSHIEKYHTPDSDDNKAQESLITLDSQNTKSADQLINEGFKIPKHMQEKFRDIFNFLNQFPEMRPVLHPA
jgi:predicted PurR-regulated permease PerM